MLVIYLQKLVKYKELFWQELGGSQEQLERKEGKVP